MPVNGVRVLPDIPKNLPSLEVLIREFETGRSKSADDHQNVASKLFTSDKGNFVKKIVEAYESNIENKNNQERTKRRWGLCNTFDDTKKSTKQNGSTPIICDTSSLQRSQNNLKKKSDTFLTPFEAHEVKDDFEILNRYYSENDVKVISKTWPGSSPKTNMYNSIDKLSMNVKSNSAKRNDVGNLKRKNNKLEKKTKNKSIICSSPLENVESKEDLDGVDFLEDILTNSSGLSSNNSYRNLQPDLYDFEEEQFESFSISLSSKRSSLRSLHNNILSRYDPLQGSSFQDVTITSFEDIPKSRENLRNSKSVPSLSFNFNSSRAIDNSSNKDRLTKTDNTTYMTWISILSEKLSQKKSLKKLKSAFNTKLWNYKKVWKKSKKQTNEISDSGFIERFISSSSSLSPSNPNKKSSISPTFHTFGHEKNVRVNDKLWSKISRVVLIDEKRIMNESKSSESTSKIFLHDTTVSSRKNQDKFSLKMNSSKLKASSGYLSLPEYSYLTWNGIPSSLTKTKLDEINAEESIEEKKMSHDAKERECNRELESSRTSSALVKPNISYPKISEWLVKSLNNNCDLLSTDFLSTIPNNPYMQKEPCTRRYATVSPKNLRFSMSQEKSRAIEGKYDV